MASGMVYKDIFVKIAMSLGVAKVDQDVNWKAFGSSMPLTVLVSKVLLNNTRKAKGSSTLDFKLTHPHVSLRSLVL
jgi:hypothetical protein